VCVCVCVFALVRTLRSYLLIPSDRVAVRPLGAGRFQGPRVAAVLFKALTGRELFVWSVFQLGGLHVGAVGPEVRWFGTGLGSCWS